MATVVKWVSKDFPSERDDWIVEWLNQLPGTVVCVDKDRGGGRTVVLAGYIPREELLEEG